MGEDEQRTLVDRVAQALRENGLTVSVQAEAEAELESGQRRVWLRVSRDGNELAYTALVKRRLTPLSLVELLAQLRQPADAGGPLPLLLCEHVTAPLADQLREQQQPFADAAGNAFLEGGGLYVYVRGRKLHPKQLALRASSGFTATRLKVLFALICDAELAGAANREIAAAADVALDAMPAVIADLVRHGLLRVIDQQRFVDAGRRLLDEWAQAYALGLRGKTLSGRYLTPEFDHWRDWQLHPGHTRWGGEAAAALLLGEQLPAPPRPCVLTIYGDKLPARLVDEQRFEAASPAAYEGLVEVRKPFWGKSLAFDAQAETVAPALIYADLLATGKAQCIEMAEMIYNALLAERFPPA